MRKTKISETIGNINQKYVSEATSYTGEGKAARRPVWMKWGAIAACFALIAVLGISIMQGGLLGGGKQIATLDNGSKISFIKSEAGVGQLDIAFKIQSRSLTDEEIHALFGDLPISAYALFNEEDGSILGLDGNYNDMKLLVSTPVVNINCAVIEGKETASEVDGVSVNAGYFISGKNVIYYASFELAGNTVYLENAGPKENGEAVKAEIASAIQNLIALKQIDLASINT